MVGKDNNQNTTNSMSKNFEYDEDIKEKYGKITKNEIANTVAKLVKL